MAFFISILLWFPAAGVSAVEGGGITDAKGRRICFDKPVRRLVVLPSDALEVIRILDAADRVVGVNDSVVAKPGLWPKLKTIPTVGHPFDPNYEQLIMVKPDCVLAYGWRPGPELEKKLLPLGITVLRLEFFRESSLIREVRDFGRILGKSAEAEKYIAWHAECVEMLRQRIGRQPRRPRVYIEAYSDYHASGPGSGGYEMGVMAGGDLIASVHAIQNPEIDTEFVVSRKPEVIVKLVSTQKAYAYKSNRELADMRRQMMQRPGWDLTPAVKNGRVHMIASDIGPGPRGIVGVLYMAATFYPGAFADMDICSLHRAYLERFQKVPYRGHYVYPDQNTE